MKVTTIQKNDFGITYVQQVDLLLKLLPIVAKESCFAIKGGTAINLFVRDLPRLSVDIDLVYLPLEDRNKALLGIEKSLLNIKNEIEKNFNGILVEEKRIKVDSRLTKLVVGAIERIKIEPNEILRGTLHSIEKRDLSKTAEDLFQQSVVNVPILSIADLYAGKICAALDRQHPRDLFDIHLLYQQEGLTNDIRQAFVIYLASGSRPMHELLNPNLIDQAEIFYNEFQGMTRTPAKYDDLIATRSQLIIDIQNFLTDNERKFLLSVKLGEPDYSLMPFKHLDQLSALQWKLFNIRKMSKSKHKEMLNLLRNLLKI